MTLTDQDLSWFLASYEKQIKDRNPCYEGLCWAADVIETSCPKQDALLLQDARALFSELYAFAVQELGKEAVAKFSESIQKQESRQQRSAFNLEREQAFWCKREIRRLEEFKKKKEL